MICQKQFSMTIGNTSFPDFVFTDVFANNGSLSAATINGYDKLAAQPANGTHLGNSVATIWTVDGSINSYTISYQCDAVASAADAGNWRITIDNDTLVPTTLSFPLGVYVYVNAVQIYFYEVNSTTGPLFVDTPLVNGDTLSFILAVDGVSAPAGSYQIDVSVAPAP